MLTHHLRDEAAVPVPGHREGDLADLGGYRLGRGPVTGVTQVPSGRVMFVIAQVGGHLGL
jgi:hypothetical protein